MRAFLEIVGALGFSVLSFGLTLLESPEHFQVPQVHFEDTRAKPQLWHRESAFVILYLVNQEYLRVAESGG